MVIVLEVSFGLAPTVGKSENVVPAVAEVFFERILIGTLVADIGQRHGNIQDAVLHGLRLVEVTHHIVEEAAFPLQLPRRGTEDPEHPIHTKNDSAIRTVFAMPDSESPSRIRNQAPR